MGKGERAEPAHLTRWDELRGDLIELREHEPHVLAAPPATIDRTPTQWQFELDGPLTVGSGESAVHGLLVTNLAADTVAVMTNGQLTASVTDKDGRRVGGYAGGQFAMGVRFSIAPASTVRIPLLVATASTRGALGFAVPPGRWWLTAPLDVDRDWNDTAERALKPRSTQYLITPTLEFTVR